MSVSGSTGVSEALYDPSNVIITGGSVAVSTLGIDGAVGNLSAPMVDLLRVNRFTGEQVGSVTVTSPAGTMYPDRYGVLQASSSGVGRFGKNGFICSPSATNNLLHSDATITDTTVSAGVTNAGSFPQFTNGLQFPATATTESAYKSFATVASTAYTFSVFVVMDDSSTPVPGLSTNGAADFYLVIDGTEVAVADYTVELINASQALYRVDASLTSAGASTNVGVARASTQSGKGFRVTGYQLETGTVATPYIPTTTAPVTVGAAYPSIQSNNNLPNPDDGVTIIVGATARLVNSTLRFFAYDDTGGTGRESRTFATTNYNGSMSTNALVFSVASADITVGERILWGFRYKQNGANVDWATFRNGIKVASGSVTGTVVHPDTRVDFGAWSGTGSLCDIDTAKVYGYLTDDEMRIG